MSTCNCWPDRDSTACKSTYYLYVEPTCHGCEGKGWVSPTYGVAAICPVCKGSGKPAPITYETKWIDCSDWVVPVLTPSTFQPYGRNDYESITVC